MIIHLEEKKNFMEVFSVLKQDNKQVTAMGNSNVNSLLWGGLVFYWTTIFNSHPVPHTCKQTGWREILKLFLWCMKIGGRCVLSMNYRLGNREFSLEASSLKDSRICSHFLLSEQSFSLGFVAGFRHNNSLKLLIIMASDSFAMLLEELWLVSNSLFSCMFLIWLLPQPSMTHCSSKNIYYLQNFYWISKAWEVSSC